MPIAQVLRRWPALYGDATVAVFYDSLIILFTLSLSLLFRKRSFCFLLFAAVWIGLGLANCILLGFRATPLTAPDIWLLSSVRDIIEIYMSQPVLILLMLGIAALIGVIVLLWLRAKKTRPSYYFAAVQVLLCGVILAGFTVAFLRSGTLASHFPNLPDAYDSNGFAYCFSASAVTQGISEPDGYSQEAIDVLLSEQDDLPADRVRTPNFIFVQLESFFDANYLKDLTYGENPVPNFERLKETCSSGLFYVPSIGAGTANTEFEVLSGMNLDHFGVGSIPTRPSSRTEPANPWPMRCRARAIPPTPSIIITPHSTAATASMPISASRRSRRWNTCTTSSGIRSAGQRISF